MRFKRQEAFRYQFGQPLPCTFRIVRIDNREIESDKGAAEIHDISPRGMRMKTSLDIPPRPREIHIEVTFMLNDVEFSFIGTLVWQRKTANDYYYGLQLLLSFQQEEILIREIKRYAVLHNSRQNHPSK
ncbi:PilZ domain-containing protein [Anoxybacillus sp. J5B_2022]|uniref:PilZ domain-containing protein n=1 Tax=Anoxybacillus sp. J5B_2022 TaxID=3003246 RepID=UPI0022854298|nr:PilZ domain-containing protein [Anoxybacillus sp. J5B_2022]MCZ0755146.1 PilZ domain-containing protein [Anoxybacillus sp. J5B_2022]